jgi:glycosyltransferase involved in cell wall biosynthesis
MLPKDDVDNIPLRILHVVTLISSDGAFGGPASVALDQASAQQRAGHSVLVAGLGRGAKPTVTRSLNGVPVHLVKEMRLTSRLGFAGLTNPGLLAWLWRAIPRFDIIHVHLARDLVTLPAAEIVLRRRGRLVLQPHGMIDESDRWLAAVLDSVSVARVLRNAHAVLGLVDNELKDLELIAKAPLPYMTLGNGVTVGLASLPVHHPDGPVLFVGRLHTRKRPVAFVESAQLVHDAGFSQRFHIVGADEGELPSIRRRISELGLEGKVSYLGARTRTEVARIMAESSVVVLPAENEPFGLVLVEAMALGIPVVCTDTCGIADEIRAAGAGIVTDGTVQELGEAIARLLRNPSIGREMGRKGRRLVAERFSIGGVAARLDLVYSRILGNLPLTQG